MERLTRQEEEIMRAIWRVGEGIIRDFIKHLPEPHPPYTTVASVVKNLERKEYIDCKQFGKIYLYRALIGESEYKAGFMSGIVKNYFADSYKELVTFFARKQKISAEELREIVALIEKGPEE